MQENKHRGCLSVLICLLATQRLPLIQLLASRETLASLSQRASRRSGEPARFERRSPRCTDRYRRCQAALPEGRRRPSAPHPHPPTAAFVYIFPRGACRHFLASLKEVSRARSRLMSSEMRPLISFQAGMIIDHLPPTGSNRRAKRGPREIPASKTKINEALQVQFRRCKTS